MGFRGYVHIPKQGEKPGISADDVCIGKMFGYMDDNRMSKSAEYLWLALSNTKEDAYTFVTASGEYTVDSAECFDDKEDMLDCFDSDYKMIVRFTKILFCEFIKAYYDDQRILWIDYYTMPERRSLKQVLDYYDIKMGALDQYIYVYWI